MDPRRRGAPVAPRCRGAAAAGPPEPTHVVRDVDASQPRTFTLSRAQVLPLPRHVDYTSGRINKHYPAGLRVMAMYPETTAFYPAVVEAPPAMPRPSGVEDGQGPEERCVAVFFEDDEPDEETGLDVPRVIPVRFVVWRDSWPSD